MGVIDILQTYDTKKQVENVYKTWRYKGTAISAVESGAYASRFEEYMSEIFRDLPVAIAASLT